MHDTEKHYQMLLRMKANMETQLNCINESIAEIELHPLPPAPLKRRNLERELVEEYGENLIKGKVLKTSWLRKSVKPART